MLCSLNQRSCKERSCPQGESVRVHAGSLQLCPTLCYPPGSPIYGVLQVWILEWFPCALFQGIFLIQESNPRLLCLLHWQEGSLPLGPPEKPPLERDRQWTKTQINIYTTGSGGAKNDEAKQSKAKDLGDCGGGGGRGTALYGEGGWQRLRWWSNTQSDLRCGEVYGTSCGRASRQREYPVPKQREKHTWSIWGV